MLDLVKIKTNHLLWLRGNSFGIRADLSGADLSGAILSSVTLSGADLKGADLSHADLTETYLTGADLSGADLSHADLRCADLSRANLTGANLSSANLSRANLNSAILTNARLPSFQIPQDLQLTVWKKLRDGSLCKLSIPEGAKRTATLVGRKCRAEYAVVLDGGGQSSYDDGTCYVTGEEVRPDSYDDDIRVECSHGIHFFLTLEEAEEYTL